MQNNSTSLPRSPMKLCKILYPVSSTLSGLIYFMSFSETEVHKHHPISSIQQHPAPSRNHGAMLTRKAVTQSLPSARGASSYSLLLSTRSILVSPFPNKKKGHTSSAITSSTVFADVHFPSKICGVRCLNMKLFPAAPAMIV